GLIEGSLGFHVVLQSIIEGSPGVHAALQSSIEGSPGIHIMVRSLQDHTVVPVLQSFF
ncbi:hypothetical protein CRENBAI_019798, partial [Crenichthys baileyi]